MTDQIPHFIGGKRRDDPEATRRGDVYDPATGRVARTVPFATSDIVDEAVASASRAFESWRNSSLSARTEVLFSYRQLLDEHAGELTAVIGSEHGKVRSDAAGELRRGIEVVEFACGIPHLLKGELAENVSREVDSYSMRQPLGVCAGITPFNFPAMVPMWMFPIAIACGNAFVLKPSEKDPSTAVRLAELMCEAGLPDGVFNVVHGDKVAVDALLVHPGIAAVSVVGSTPVARYVYENAAQHGKRVQALGGAKNHMVVLPDADLDAAADAAVGAAYGSTGQRCMAVSAVVAVGDAGDELVRKIDERVSRLRVGPASDPEAEMGPLVTGAHRDKVASYLESGVNEGAVLAIDRREMGPDGGFFLGPCLFDHVTTDMQIYKDEIFGPILVVLRAAGLDEALRIVNSNPYGNGAAIFTRNGRAARTFQHEVTSGMVGINVPIPVPMAYFSFGGWKQSLFGDSHVHGMEGVRFYTRVKVVTSRWPEGVPGGGLAFPA